MIRPAHDGSDHRCDRLAIGIEYTRQRRSFMATDISHLFPCLALYPYSIAIVWIVWLTPEVDLLSNPDFANHILAVFECYPTTRVSITCALIRF